MIEKFKTILLTLLITSSLYLSYLMAYSTPKYEPIAQNDYVQTEQLGNQVDLKEVLAPDQIVFHSGTGLHTALYPYTGYYNTFFTYAKQRNFEGVRKIPLIPATMNWDDLRTKRKGIEMRFYEGMPMQVIQKMLQIKLDLPIENELITSVWMYVKENN
jgi:regulatory protein YycH of two-component signal transduction system YycFG